MAVTINTNNTLPSHTPVCALGASAGGVAALKSFFANVRPDLGLAYVVVVHLAPDHPSSMGEILAAETQMSVVQIEASAQLEPNCVYVIPPNRELVIAGDNLTARPFTESRGRRSPIDMFFHSVAAARGDGIAIVLSGSGSDGTAGIRAVKEAGGVILAQEPSEAEYAMMPENAISTGLVDFVAPVKELATRVAEVVRSKKGILRERDEDVEQQIRQIVAFVRRRTGHDFSNYKRATIMRRVTRRMQVARQESLADYYRYLQSNKSEVHELFSDLLISVTSFFRDSTAFEALTEQVLKPLFDRLDGEASIRVWVAGCATGEEAYSLGILLLEEAARRGTHPLIQIFATDIDEAALITAREGRYPKSIEADVSEERLKRFFVQDESFFRVKKELRDLVLFALHSALKDPPFIKIDLICCRNLLIYLQRELQRQLCALFHYALKPNGYVFLGSAETMDAAQPLFSPIDRDARIYVAIGASEKVAPLLPQLTSDFHRLEQRLPQPVQRDPGAGVGHAHAAALEESAPPSVLVDSTCKILHLSPNAGRFFRPLEGPFSADLSAQVRPELRVDLKLALQRAMETGESSLSVPIPVAFNGDAHLVALHVRRARAGDETVAGQALVFFMDLGKAPTAAEGQEEEHIGQTEIKRLRQELSAAQERLSAGRREYEQATQDLRAANEELQSINEEYRSTAEELETSKEELQSINEELQTVNGELKSKLDTISTAHNDLENLVAATEIGTLFLDPNCRIRFFTPRAHDYFNISKADVGRALSDFSHRLVYDHLEQDVAGVLKSLTPVENSIKTTDGRWVAMQIRPYRTLDDKIDGVVITLTDITKLKLAEEGLASELRAMARLQELSTKVMEANRLEGPLGAILQTIVELIGGDFGSIQLFDEPSQTLRLVAHRGFQQRFLDHFAIVDASSGSACGLALSKCERVAFEDVETEPAFAPSLEEAREAGYRAVVSAPLCSTSGKLVGMLAVHFRERHQFSPHELRLVDICARQAADAINVQLLQQALREADRRKDEFLAVLAHELRNPLTPIHNTLEVLKRKELPEEIRRLDGVIERQTSHLIRLVEDLLDVARITRGKIELRRRPIDVTTTVQQAVETTTPLIEAKQQTINVAFSEETLIVDADPVRLSQVFSNLLNNASKFSPAGGHIEVSARRDGDDVIVSIRDEGVGFSSDSLTHAFELFNQGDQKSGQGQSGIGVGLALARALVELHGGTIDALSNGVGKGSELQVRLHLSRSRPAVETGKTQPPAGPRVIARRVLIVDDKPDVADSLAALAQSLGAEVRSELDGPSALAAIPSFKPDIAIVDIGLPLMDGYQLAGKIRKLPEGKNLVLVALSGWGQDDARQRALRAGFVQFFVKPLDTDTLEKLLATAPESKT